MKKWKKGAKIGLITAIIIELFSLFLADVFGLYKLREFGDALAGFGLVLFPLFFALLGLMVGHAFTTKLYWQKGGIIGFFVMFSIFVANSFTAPETGCLTGDALLTFIILSLIPAAIILGAFIGYLINRLKKQ